MRRPLASLAGLALALVLAAACPARPLPGTAAPAGFAAGEVLVRFKPSLGREALAAARRAALSAVSATAAQSLDALRVERWTLSAGADPKAAAAALAMADGVAAAEPNYRVRVQDAYLPHNSLYAEGYQGWLTEIAGDGAYAAWRRGELTFPATVTVAVVDTGVDTSAKDLRGASFASGHDFVNDIDGAVDDNGHGTFVAGIIAAAPVSPCADAGWGACGVYACGMQGVAFTGVRVLPVKVMDAGGDGTLFNVARGVVYAADNQARVANMSLGASEKSDVLEQAMAYALAHGCLPVAAAGNYDTETFYPARYTQCLAVGALVHGGGRVYYSNHGKIDLSAPGGDGLSDAALGAPAACVAPVAPALSEIVSLSRSAGVADPDPQDYLAWAGTSFACPMVAATAGLLFAQDNTRGVGEVMRLLTQSSDPVGGGFSQDTGWGRLNVYRALRGDTAGRADQARDKAYVWPNPFSPAQHTLAHLCFTMASAGDATVRLFDMGQDLVRQWDLPGGTTRAGLNQVDWDGRNGRGVQVANGVYKLVVTGAGSRRVAYIAVAR